MAVTASSQTHKRSSVRKWGGRVGDVKNGSDS